MGFLDSFKKKEDSPILNSPQGNKDLPPLSKLVPPPPGAPAQGAGQDNLPLPPSPGGSSNNQENPGSAIENAFTNSLDKSVDSPAQKRPLPPLTPPPKRHLDSEPLFQSAPLPPEKNGVDFSYTQDSQEMQQPTAQHPSEVPLDLPQLPPLSQQEGSVKAGPNFQTKTYMTHEVKNDNEIIEDIPYFSDVGDQALVQEANPMLDDLPMLDAEGPEIYRNLRPEITKPLFIRTDFYSQVLTNLDNIKSYVNESSEIIYNLENLKRNSDSEHRYFKKVLEDIQRKLIYIDRVLFNG